MVTQWILHPAISYARMAELCRARLVAGRSPPTGSGSESIGTSDRLSLFTGTVDMGEAIAGLERGIKADTAGVVAAMQQYHEAAYSLPTWEHSVAGQRVCIASYVAGEPECMLARTEETDTRSSVRLVLSGNAPSRIHADALMLMSTAAAIVAESLLASQIRTAIVGVDATNDHLTPYAIIDLDDVLDVSKIAFSLHPSMQRRVWFAVREMSPSVYTEPGARNDGYGSAPSLDTAAKKLLSAAVATDDVVTVFLPGPRELALGPTTLAAYVEAFQQAIALALAAHDAHNAA